MNRRLAALAGAGVVVVAVARIVVPGAPAVYDGLFLNPPPYHYTSPPPALASSNVLPDSAEVDVPLVNGVNAPNYVETNDKQVTVVFAANTFVAPALTSLHIRVSAIATLPPPPFGSLYVGNVYSVMVTATTPPSPGPGGAVGQPALAIPARVLLRVPPVPYTSVRGYYGGQWHLTPSRGQTYVLSTLNQLGDIAAFIDLTAPFAKKPATQPAASSVPVALTVVLGLLALAVVVTGVVVQRNRARR